MWAAGRSAPIAARLTALLGICLPSIPTAGKVGGTGATSGTTVSQSGSSSEASAGPQEVAPETSAGGARPPVCPVEPYEVGIYSDLKARSTSGDGLDIHHVPQAHPAGQSIPGYLRENGPYIALPARKHRVIPTLRGPFAGTPEDIVSQDLQNVSDYTNAPEDAVDQLKSQINEQFPDVC